MAARHGIGIIKDVALTADTAKTCLQLIAATNHAIRWTGLTVGTDGTDNTYEPILVELVRQTDAGTSGDSLTLAKADDSVADSLDTTAQSDVDGGEPTGSTVLRSWRCHPQAGMDIGNGTETPLIIGAGDRLGVRVTSANSLNVDVSIYFEE